MKDSSRETVSTRFTQQIFFDCRLLNPVLSKWPARLFFGRWHNDAGPVNPDCSAVEKMLNVSTKCFDQVLRTCRGKADQINHYVRFQFGDLPTEPPGGLFFLSIDLDSLSRSPCCIRKVRLSLTAAD
jgi:hypothetical protein